MSNNVEQTKQEMDQIELLIGKILRVGVAVAGTVMFVGLVAFFITGTSGYSGQNWPTSFHAIFAGLASFKPFAVMMLGLFLLILTPVLRVVVSIFAFAKENDKLYVWITIGVLAILVIAMIIGHQ
ncbi:DUF1634 domain-containing protein [Periweissella cryptocerci]|uniref:DUF1634 domain-containing protein n=1 Tax=Periweissella cryptocerci TaxID=2506420 RepID=A0A4P6YTP3_9LACO|nr:DUF1634 domain-containing protein [Periweissella cryptocerci]QBO36056.1 DUF1634 domain-containing protein [Periweissella cryptocerci]